MNWDDLNEARQKLSLTEAQMARLLKVGLSTYKGWGTRGKVPDYIVASVEAHLLLSKRALAQLMAAREI
jgi:DNA-binding transcriptional regulator YiaG